MVNVSDVRACCVRAYMGMAVCIGDIFYVVMMTDNQPKGYILYRRAELKLFG
jgi:hypothetical protein